MVWFGLFGLVWVGLVWFGLVWFGLVWSGKVHMATHVTPAIPVSWLWGLDYWMLRFWKL